MIFKGVPRDFGAEIIPSNLMRVMPSKELRYSKLALVAL